MKNGQGRGARKRCKVEQDSEARKQWHGERTLFAFLLHTFLARGFLAQKLCRLSLAALALDLQPGLALFVGLGRR